MERFFRKSLRASLLGLVLVVADPSDLGATVAGLADDAAQASVGRAHLARRLVVSVVVAIAGEGCRRRGHDRARICSQLQLAGDLFGAGSVARLVLTLVVEHGHPLHDVAHHASNVSHWFLCEPHHA